MDGWVGEQTIYFKTTEVLRNYVHTWNTTNDVQQQKVEGSTLYTIPQGRKQTHNPIGD